jgi:hypothetical protein
MARYGFGGDQWLDSNGKPLSGGKLYFYETGTDIAKTTYSNLAMTIANSWPVSLDTAGRQGDVFFSGAAKVVIKSAANVVIDEVDPVYPVQTTTTVVVGDETGITVETYADLLLIEGDVDNATCTMLGFTTPSDGGGGVFYWDSTSSATVNIGTVVKPTATVGAGRWLRIFEPGTVNVKWFGAFCNGVADDTTAVNAASAAVSTGGTVIFPYGEQDFTFTKPAYGVSWNFNGPEVTREQIGGTSSAVRFVKPRLYYLDGPHETDQLQAEHLRVIAKGSDAIGAQYADYALGITAEKENWTEEDGLPVAGELNCVTYFLRNGCETGDPVKTGGAAILANVGQTEGSGNIQLLEAVNQTFDKTTLVAERETRLQLLTIDEVTDLSYAINAISVTGSQNGVLRTQGTTAAPWGNIIENLKDSVLTYRVNDEGKISWRNSDGVQSSVEIEETSGDLVFKNDADEETARIKQTGIVPRYTTGTTETITGDDNGRLVSFANTSPITCELSATAPPGTCVHALQRDTGQVTFTPASGAILRNSRSSVATYGEWSLVTLGVSINAGGSSAVWYLAGDIDLDESIVPRYTTGTSETITAADHDKLVSLANGSPISCVLSAAAPAGTIVRALQRDAGQVTFSAASGATLRNRQSHTKTAGEWAIVTLQVSINSGGSAAVWYLSGDTAA